MLATCLAALAFDSASRAVISIVVGRSRPFETISITEFNAKFTFFVILSNIYDFFQFEVRLLRLCSCCLLCLAGE